jgi:hypothetical protein
MYHEKETPNWIENLVGNPKEEEERTSGRLGCR